MRQGLLKLLLFTPLHVHAQNQPAGLSAAAAQRSILLCGGMAVNSNLKFQKSA